MVESCPNCEFTSETLNGVKRHYGQVHDGSIAGATVNCSHCGDEVKKDPYRLERSNNLFCSTQCHDLWRSENVAGEDAGGWDGGHLIDVECEYCGTVFEEKQHHVSLYEHNFCGQGCYGDWMSESGSRSGENNPMFGVDGSDHPCWEGGHDQSWRREPRWRKVARRTYKQYDYTCQECGESQVELHAHHIVPVHDGGDKYDEENLVALCAKCHYDRHST